MANPVLIAAPVAIVPAVAALWYLLKRYEAYFEDARVFLSLTVGFFAGLVAIAMERLLFPFESPQFVLAVGAGSAFVLFVVGYALFETAAKLVVLGTRAYRGRKDSPYYGAALGLGMGAMMALGYIAINLNVADALDQRANGTASGLLDTPYQVLPFFGMALVPLGAVLVHGAAGVYVGKEVGKGSLWRGWLVGAGLQAPVIGTFWLYAPSIGQANVFVPGPGIMSLAYGVILMHIARVRVLDRVVPKELLDRIRRDERRKARAAARGDAAEAAPAASGAAHEPTEDGRQRPAEDADPGPSTAGQGSGGPEEGARRGADEGGR